MNRAESPAHRWQTKLRPCCVGAPGRRQLARQVAAFPSCRAWGYRPAEYPALCILDGGWIGASALFIHGMSSLPAPQFALPLLRRHTSVSSRDSSVHARSWCEVVRQRRVGSVWNMLLEHNLTLAL